MTIKWKNMHIFETQEINEVDTYIHYKFQTTKIRGGKKEKLKENM